MRRPARSITGPDGHAGSPTPTAGGQGRRPLRCTSCEANGLGEESPWTAVKRRCQRCAGRPDRRCSGAACAAAGAVRICGACLAPAWRAPARGRNAASPGRGRRGPPRNSAQGLGRVKGRTGRGTVGFQRGRQTPGARDRRARGSAVHDVFFPGSGRQWIRVSSTQATRPPDHLWEPACRTWRGRCINACCAPLQVRAATIAPDVPG